MISFRYHIVSLVAVFLALAVGIIAGSTVVDQNLIQSYESRYNRDQRDLEDLTDLSDVLRAEVLLWEGFGDDLLLPALEGRLNGIDVTIVLPPFTPDPFRVDLRAALRDAGARVDGEVRLGARFTLDDETADEQLALAIDAGTRRGDDLLRAAGTWLGERAGDAMLDGLEDGSLSDADFVDIAERKAGTSAEHVTLVAWDVTRENRDFAGTLMESLLAAAADTGESVVVAEALAQDPSLATRVRDSNALRAAVATIDHAATTLGSVALAAAIADLVARPKVVHHFGVLGGATAVLPEDAFSTGEPEPSQKPSAKPSSTPSGSPTRRRST